MLRLKALLALAAGETIAWGILFYAFAAILARRPSIATGISFALLASAVAAPIVARGIARFGTRAVMTTGASLAIVSLAGLALAESPAWWIALGVAQAMTLYEPAFAAIVAWFPEAKNRRRALVLVTVFGALAGPIFLPLTAFAYGRFGWSVTVGAAAAAFALVFAAYAVVPTTRPIATPVDPPHGSSAFLAVIFGVQSFVATGVMVHLVASVGMLAALAGLSQIGGRVILSLPSRTLPTRTRVAVILAAQAFAVLLLTRFPAAGVILFGATNGALTVERPVVVVERFGEPGHLAAGARITSAALFARAGAPAAVDALRARGSYDFAFFVLAVALLGAAITFSASFGEGQRLWRREPRDC